MYKVKVYGTELKCMHFRYEVDDAKLLKFLHITEGYYLQN